ncbi:hypothetical protein GALL_445370 [mine drainage metagenome]|uniref:YjiS-like domain-containing protein n=1 Tax=mine drainage metagenome TaxID=410659 RepID=A0A1J5Q1R2_9ZZZZ
MAADMTTRPAPFGAITTFKIVSFFGAAALALSAWNDSRVTRKSLGKLSDRELDDIGLCRSDIEVIARDRA